MIELDNDQQFLMIGDTHGQWRQMLKALELGHKKGIKVFVHLGDFGIWHNDKPYLNQIEYLLKVRDSVLYFIDGNHENFPRLYEKPILEDGTRKVRDHIFHLPRGFRWEWADLSFVALGGAASIDKKFRTEGMTWWPEELITDEDIAKAIEGGKADVMFTHDSPASAPNSICDDARGQRIAEEYYGKAELAYCTAHRIQLQKATDVITPKLLFHGHYHKLMQGVYRHQDKDGSVGSVIGLDEGLAPTPHFTMVFDFEIQKQVIAELNKYK